MSYYEYRVKTEVTSQRSVTSKHTSHISLHDMVLAKIISSMCKKSPWMSLSNQLFAYGTDSQNVNSKDSHQNSQKPAANKIKLTPAQSSLTIHSNNKAIEDSRLCPSQSFAKVTRHRASTSMYSLTFCVSFSLPERHQRKPAVQAAAVIEYIE